MENVRDVKIRILFLKAKYDTLLEIFL